MKTIEFFRIPNVPECTVILPQGLSLIDADVETDDKTDDEINIYYMDDRASDQTVVLTWYVLTLGMEVADNFPGVFFKRVTMSDGFVRFLFFKQDAKKRPPIVAVVKDAK